MSRSQHDAIVIGAGHNGLVAAAYLAKAGKSVLVLERSETVGGIAVTSELWDGYRFSTCADAASSYLSPRVQVDLQLQRHGLEIVAADPIIVSPQPDGRALTIWRDTARTAAEIERFSPTDAQRYPEFVDFMRRLAGMLRGLMQITPPDLPEVSRRDLVAMLPLLGPYRRLGRRNLSELLRVTPMPVTDLLDEWFESDALKGTIAANGVRGMSWGPREAGTAYMLLHRWACSDTGLFRSAGVVVGGIGKLTEALASAARSHGAEIRTSAPVERILTTAGRVDGVALADGSEERATDVVSSADPRTTFLTLLDPGRLPASFVRQVRNIKYRGSTARVHLALRGTPSFPNIAATRALNGSIGHLQIAPTMDYLQRAYDHVKYREMSAEPYLDVSVPSTIDSTVAPEGGHTISVAVQYTPYHINGGWDDTGAEILGERVLSMLENFAPDLATMVEGVQPLTPADLERTYQLPEGNLHHGEMTLDQLLHMRPVPGWGRYRTPLHSLWLCGAGTHPGGTLSGLPGRNAARQILSGQP